MAEQDASADIAKIDSDKIEWPSKSRDASDEDSLTLTKQTLALSRGTVFDNKRYANEAPNMLLGIPPEIQDIVMRYAR